MTRLYRIVWVALLVAAFSSWAACSVIDSGDAEDLRDVIEEMPAANELEMQEAVLRQRAIETLKKRSSVDHVGYIECQSRSASTAWKNDQVGWNPEFFDRGQDSIHPFAGDLLTCLQKLWMNEEGFVSNPHYSQCLTKVMEDAVELEELDLAQLSADANNPFVEGLGHIFDLEWRCRYSVAEEYLPEAIEDTEDDMMRMDVGDLIAVMLSLDAAPAIFSGVEFSEILVFVCALSGPGNPNWGCPGSDGYPGSGGTVIEPSSGSGDHP